MSLINLRYGVERELSVTLDGVKSGELSIILTALDFGEKKEEEATVSVAATKSPRHLPLPAGMSNSKLPVAPTPPHAKSASVCCLHQARPIAYLRAATTVAALASARAAVGAGARRVGARHSPRLARTTERHGAAALASEGRVASGAAHSTARCIPPSAGVCLPAAPYGPSPRPLPPAWRIPASAGVCIPSPASAVLSPALRLRFPPGSGRPSSACATAAFAGHRQPRRSRQGEAAARG